MAEERKRPEAPRGEKVLPGVWRLRLALPWPGVPHGNAWAVAADGGIVLFDTGIGGKGRHAPVRPRPRPGRLRPRGREAARLHPLPHRPLRPGGPDRRGRRLRALDAPRLGARAPACRRSGGGARAAARGGPPERRAVAGLERYRESRKDDDDNGIDAIVEPDRDLLPGVEVETDLGTWQVHETPGHAPSHVVLHQPERKLMISGDHLLGRTVLFFDHGHSPDPVGEFLGSLDEVEPLEVDLCLPGHGRPFRDPRPRSPRRAARSTSCWARPARRSAKGRRPASRSSPRSSAPRTSTPRSAPGSCRSSSPASTTWRSWARSSRSRGPIRSDGARLSAPAAL